MSQSGRWVVGGYRLGAALLGVAVLAGQAAAQVGGGVDGHAHTGEPVYRLDTGVRASTLYHSGEQVLAPTEEVWRFMCGTETAGLTAADLQRIAAEHGGAFGDPDQVIVVDNGPGRGGLNIVFNLGAGVPSAAVPAFAACESYLETLFQDPITVSVNVSFANMGPGVLGATSTSYTNTTWPNSRTGLINGKDIDDSIQDWLPTGTTIPVRYVGSSATVTNETRVFWTVASYRATIGSISGSAGSMQFNTQFNWDYDPSNGVSGYSFRDVVIHEVGHALGFVSGADFRTSDMEALDIFRFARADGTGTDWNPDTLAEFQTTARCVDNNLPNDDANSDVIAAEYRMSDGSPYQASHFREQFGTAWIGLMDPALSSGETHQPNYFSAADLTMFDAIGWDYTGSTTCEVTITTHPQSQTVCEFDFVTLEVVGTGTGALEYQWRHNGGDIPGANSSTYNILGVTTDDAGTYTCVVSVPCGSQQTSNPATLTVNAYPTISQHPQSQTVDEGDPVTFTVTAGGTSPTYQWRKDGGNIPGATGSSYTIVSAAPADEGDYDVVVTTPCGSTTSNAATLTVTPGGGGCYGDFNGDGQLTVADFTAFRGAFLAGDMSADCDESGGLTVADFTCFRNAFLAGCG